MSLVMPRTEVEAIGKPRQTFFPEGIWSVTMEEVNERELPEWFVQNVADGKNCGYVSGEGTRLSLTFGGGSNVAGETTNQKLFVDLVVRDGDYVIDAPFPAAAWQLRNSARLAMTLAASLGATDDVEVNGVPSVAMVPDFFQQLADGYFIGTEVMAEVYHRNWDNGVKTGTEVNVASFTGV